MSICFLKIESVKSDIKNMLDTEEIKEQLRMNKDFYKMSHDIAIFNGLDTLYFRKKREEGINMEAVVKALKIFDVHSLDLAD